MFGISLPPSMLLPDPMGEDAVRMGKIFGSTENLLCFLRGLGVSSVEIRNISPGTDPEVALICAKKIWNAGMNLTVHGALPSEEGDFEEVYGSLLPLLREAGSHQPYVTLTVHAYRSENESDLPLLKERTVEVLRLFAKDAGSFGFRLAVENEQQHEAYNPGISCRGVCDIIRELDPEVVGTTLDFGHFYANQIKNAEPDKIPPEEFLKRCFQTHIHAYGGRTHMPFTAGNTLPLTEYADCLLKTGYSGVLNLELGFDRFRELDWRECIRDSLRKVKETARIVQPKFINERKSYAAWAESHYGEELSCIERDLGDVNREENRFYLITSSGMLFKTQDAVFGVDFALRTENALRNAGDSLRKLCKRIPYMFISHDHDDHFNIPTVNLLADLPIRWYIPSFMKHTIEMTKLPEEKITYIRAGDCIELPGLRAEVFQGCHYEPNGTGINEVQFLFTVSGKKIYLPGDVRDYGVDRFPKNIHPDVMVANVWLGRGVSQNPPVWAYDEFCDFISYFSPKQVYLGHLMEYMREPQDIWTYSHSGILLDGLTERIPEAQAEELRLFHKYLF